MLDLLFSNLRVEIINKAPARYDFARWSKADCIKFYKSHKLQLRILHFRRLSLEGMQRALAQHLLYQDVMAGNCPNMAYYKTMANYRIKPLLANCLDFEFANLFMEPAHVNLLLFTFRAYHRLDDVDFMRFSVLAAILTLENDEIAKLYVGAAFEFLKNKFFPDL